MLKTLDPFRLLLISLAGWMNHKQQLMIDYLREENRVLHAQIGPRRLRRDSVRALLCWPPKLPGGPVLARSRAFLDRTPT